MYMDYRKGLDAIRILKTADEMLLPNSWKGKDPFALIIMVSSDEF